MNLRLDSNYLHGVIGNGRSAALIEPDSSIVFACLPDFDSGTVFASLLDPERGGSFRVEMEGGHPVAQAYEPRTNVLVTTFEGPDGSFRVIDFMPRYTWDGRAGSDGDAPPDIVRVLEPIRGLPRLRVHYDPRLEYGRFPTVHAIDGTRIKSTTRGEVAPTASRGRRASDPRVVYESLYLYTDIDANDVRSGNVVTLDHARFLLVSYHDKVQQPSTERVQLMLQRTRAYWMLWSARTTLPERYTDEVLRSALTLRMLQFDPTGAVVAAVTTSLPETIGEERNWDYRFCWIRDASMTVSVLRRLSHPGMASRFIDWILDTVPTKDDELQIMYGLRGEKELTEETLEHLAGYHGSRPVRTGNAAHGQRQHDIFGVMLDVVLQDLLLRKRTPEALDRLWTRVRSEVRTVDGCWRDPDRGIWEIRGEPRHFVFSKVLSWVAVDRGIAIARHLGKDRWAEDHVALANEIHAEICDKGWSERLGAFTQTYGSEDLDASNLLMAEYGFLAADDPRFVSTVLRTRQELGRDGLLYRYKNKDDFGLPKSAFTVCSFWLVKALASIGRRREARQLFEELLAAANPHGLFGEDLDFESRRQLGNFPQAYSHLALIDCALALEHDDEHAVVIEA
ncbi:MAG: glycoside hydrolase family 15 protein [Planctomycetota bacterium]